MRAVRFALSIALALTAVPALAGDWTLPFPSTVPPAEAPLENLYVQFEGDVAPVSVVSIIKQPVHVGSNAGAKLQLPQQVSTTSLRANVNTRQFKLFDLNNDGTLNRSELTQALLAWAVTSELEKPFAKASFFYGTQANALAPLNFFVLNHDDAAYLRRTIVMHGRVGSVEMLEAISRAK